MHKILFWVVPTWLYKSLDRQKMAQQVRNKISLAEQVRLCRQCKIYSSQPLWGHFYCSYHRVCSGYDRWVPEECTDCLKQSTLLIALNPDERPSFLKELKEMCIRTREFKLKKGYSLAIC